MTAVERVTPFMTQERNQSPITEGHVAKKSTAKNSKYWSDLNNLSQKSADSQTSSSQNSGPLFPEDDSLETDELNDSKEMVVNGNGRMSDDEVEEGELLSNEGDGKEDPHKIVCANADEQNGSKTNETIPKMDDNASHGDSPLSSLEETQEENPHFSNGVLSQDAASGKYSPTEDAQRQLQCDNDSLNDKADKSKSRIMNDNGVNSEKSSMVSEDSDSNSNGVSSKISKLLISSSGSDKNKLLVSETFKGNLKDVVRRVSVQSESDRDSGCSSPKSVGKGNLFENILQREDLFRKSVTDTEEDRNTESANEETKPNGSMDKVTDQETNNVEECEKECRNELSANKSDGHTKLDNDNSILDEPDPDANKNRENSVETNGEEVNDLKENRDEEMNEASKDDDEVLKTDDVVIKHDIEMTEDTECDKDTKIVTKVEDTECDKDTKIVTKVENIETMSANKESIKKEEDEVGKQANGRAKRPLSPADAPSTAAKRSKLEEMIGRLSSSVGKKPEEVENMDDVESDSTSDSETSSENDKQITLSVKELHSIIQKRIDVVLKNEKTKMQKKVEELQSNVEVWKTQAKELQNQLMELSTKSLRERRRQSSKVQAAQYQQGLNSGGKASPRTPTTPTGTAPARPLLNNSTGQNAITVKNAQMRPIAPHPGKETVRSLLDSRERSAATTTGSASRNVRPSPNAKTSALAKQQPGGCIDLTDDDDKGSSTKQATNMRTVVQTSQILTPVVQANALRSGILLPGSPVVLQPVTQGVRLGQGNVVYASGTSIVRPGVTVAGQVPQLRPGQILLQQQRSASNAVAVNRPPPPLKSAPGVQKHPAPLPPTPASAGTYPKQPPPKPSLKISRVQQGIVLSWNMTLGKSHSEVTNYQLFAYQETSAAPSTNLWKKVGDVKALPLPMACTLTQFQEGNKYHFAVRAIDTHNRIGSFSDACSIHLAPSS